MQQTDLSLPCQDRKNGSFSCQTKSYGSKNDGNEAALEAYSPGTANGYASENDVFSFYLTRQHCLKNYSMLLGKVTSQSHFTVR
jgi:hypothetical protein